MPNAPAEMLPRTAWRQRIAGQLATVLPGFKLIAEGWLADQSRIDLVGALDGGAMLVDIAEPGAELECLGRLLAHSHWVRPRISDWLKLNPNLGISADAPIRCALVGPDLTGEVLAAIDALPPSLVVPINARWSEGASGSELTLERLSGSSMPPFARLTAIRPASASATPIPSEPTGPSPFRTGLTDADLGLNPEELAEFE